MHLSNYLGKNLLNSLVCCDRLTLGVIKRWVMKKIMKELLKNPDSYEQLPIEEQNKYKQFFCTLSSDKLKEILDSIPLGKGNALYGVVVRYYAMSLASNEFQIDKIIENITYERALKYIAEEKFNPYNKITSSNENAFKRIRKNW